MSRYTWLFDPGHDGLGPGGEYLNLGKQSPEVPPGIYEGPFNRTLAQTIADTCIYRGILGQVIAPGPINISLSERVDYANAIHDLRGNCIYLSIHANAMDGGWGEAEGSVAFHYPGSTTGEALAASIVESLDICTPLASRGVKTSSGLYVLNNTTMPAVLAEVAFMTNKTEAAYMDSYNGKVQIVDAFMRTIMKFEEKQ